MMIVLLYKGYPTLIEIFKQMRIKFVQNIYWWEELKLVLVNVPLNNNFHIQHNICWNLVLFDIFFITVRGRAEGKGGEKAHYIRTNEYTCTNVHYNVQCCNIQYINTALLFCTLAYPSLLPLTPLLSTPPPLSPPQTDIYPRITLVKSKAPPGLFLP